MSLKFAAPEQMRAGINMTMTALLATTYYMVKSVLDPSIPPNAGLARPIQVEAPLGSILNCVSPAAVNGRLQTCQRVADRILGALAQPVPERVMACSNSACTVAYFIGKRFGRRRFLTHLSPSKTYAGLIGGIIAATVVVGAILVGLGRPPLNALILGPLLSLAAQAGDLAESMLKRAADVERKTLSAFLLDKGLQAAAETLADRTEFRLSARQFQAFAAALDAPVKPRRRLEQLLATPSVLE